MALLVKADGTKEPLQVPDTGGSQLGFLQGLVGGMIEHVPILNEETLADGYTSLFCNEEGKMTGLPANELATKMAGRDGSYGFVDPLCGDCLFFKDGEVE